MLGHSPISATPIAAIGASLDEPLSGAPFLLPQRRRGATQPGERLVIDKSHPLARGLLLSLLNSARDYAGQPYNYATEKLIGTRVGGTFATDARGVLQRFNGSSEYLAIPIDLSPYRQLTFSWWMYTPSWSSNDALAFEYTTNSNTNDAIMINPGSSATGNFDAVAHGNGSGYSNKHIARPSVGWHHYSISFDLTLTGNAQIAAFRLDGVDASVGSSLNSTTPFTLPSSTLYVMCRAGTGLFRAGAMSNVNVHGRVLSLGEARALFENSYQFLRQRPLPSVAAPASRTIVSLPRRLTLITRQPAGAVQIDWNHPMTRGLVSSMFNSGEDARRTFDYVQNRVGVLERGGRIVTDRFGIHQDPNGNNVAGRQIGGPVLSQSRFVTISWWEWINAITATSFGMGYVANHNGVMINPASGTGRYELWIHDSANAGTIRASIRGIARPASGQWHHFLWMLDLDDNANKGFKDIKVNLVSQMPGLSYNGYYGDISAPMRLQDNLPINFANQTIAGGSTIGNSRFRNFNIWTRLLSDVEQRSLYVNPWQFLRPVSTAQWSVSHVTTEIAGPNMIGGRITASGVPVVGAIIRLYLESTGELLRQTTTDAAGDYHFGDKGNELTPGAVYTVIAYDALTGYQYNGGILRGMKAGQVRL